jgi:hypothetical protein
MDSLQLYDLMSQQHAAEAVPASAGIFPAFSGDWRQRGTERDCTSGCPCRSCGTRAKRKYSAQSGFPKRKPAKKARERAQGRDVMARETGGNAAGGNDFHTSRRRFLGSSGLAAIGAVMGGVLPLPRNGAGIPQAHAQAAPAAVPEPAKGPQYLKFPGKNEGLVVLGEKPLVAETPESLLDDDTTPIDKFYIRNNGQIPEEAKNPDAWKITIDGEVNNKIEITLGDLK